MGDRMAGFFGESDYSVDPKGRLNVPAKFRKALSPEAEETFYIERGFNNCLRAFPKDVWNRRMAKLAALPKTPGNIKHMRVLSRTSTMSTLDVQGRIMLTPSLMEYAGITKEVKILGMGDCIELWEPAKCVKETESEQDFNDMLYEIEGQLDNIENQPADI
jgi:MraZ protein